MNKGKKRQINTDPKAKKLLKAVFCEWCLLHLMRKIKFQAFYFCCFCFHELAKKQSNEGNETNLLALLTFFVLFCFVFVLFLCPFFFSLSIGFNGKNCVVDPWFFFFKDLNPLNPKVSYQFGEFGLGSTNNPLIDIEEM